MTISAKLVMELRNRTGAGIMEAKNALTQTDADIEAAVEWLRANGMAKAAKKAGRATAEGMVGLLVQGKRAVAVEVNSETDFVAKNEHFRDLVRRVAKTAIAVDGLDALLAASVDDGTVADLVNSRIVSLGENLAVRRMARIDGESVASYLHNAVDGDIGRIGVLVASEGGNPEFGHQVAMHIAASRPASLTEHDMDKNVADAERRVLMEKARLSGKPEGIIEKMVAGGMKKFYAESTLLNQKFVIDPELTVGDAAQRAGAKITGFLRFEVGEPLSENA